MKKILLGLMALIGYCNTSQAQIALTYDDTLICRCDTITMGASVTGQISGLQFDDDFTPAVEIGFPFQFFGNTYTQVTISDNNYLSFNMAHAGQTYSAYQWNAAVNNGHVGNAIMLGLMDLLLDPAYGNGSGVVQFQTLGSPGSRRFVVQYCNAAKYSGNCGLYKVTNQVILYEGTNIIEFHTEDMPGTPTCPSTNGAASGGNGIQGVRYLNGTTVNEVFTPGRAPADLWGGTGGQNTSRRFTPIPTAPFYTVDSIQYNPLYIIQQANSNLIKWYDANGTFVHTGSTYTTPVCDPPSPAPGTYFVVEYDGPAGCSSSQTFTFRDTINVRFSDIKTYRNEAMCAGATYDFYGRTLFSPGVYDTTFSSQIGCDSTIILTLNVNPLPTAEIVNGERPRICVGDRYIFRAAKAADYNYQWMKDGVNIPGATQDTFGATTAGTYSLKVTNSNGCSKTSDQSVLTISPNPNVRINYVSNNEICAEDTVTFSALATGENLEYSWTPDVYFRHTNTDKKAARVNGIIPQSGYVTVTVRNNDLCEAKDSVFIKAEPCCELRMPNAFTPNNDGKNDYFIPSLEVGQKIFHFAVFDRFGQMIYESTSANTLGWDGKNKKGIDVPGGVYMYILRYACSDEQNYEKKGDVTLMR